MPQQAKIAIEGVTKEFATETGDTFVALTTVNCTVADREFVSLVGPSGCGKTTLLEIVAGLQAPTSGRVLMDGEEIEGPGPDHVVIFQQYALFPWRTVAANVEFPMEVAGVGRAERRERALEYLGMVGLDGFADHHIWQLSGGMQQRAALARGIACQPKVMLMDEPFSGADAITREILQDLLARLRKETRQTIIFVTHSVDEAIRLSDRIMVMGTRPGRIISTFDVTDDLRDHGDRVTELREAIWSVLRNEIVPIAEEEERT
ncbi:MAG: ABC transporter ATP-binding protein [Rhodospirillaceae bacterium]|nr:ABC transporter ATP-binding protein [Rhodospirillaceae bacterium]MYH36259.1 ABC transporter ATP-binding protein [Rhodospirillaceae bacterium]MYK15247.1 ABC transporter ATP-binding protein [Rhodospirillaceae bacterium]MYK59806.1 ABC transporter ATP-binding protein [Rhodospirillaceae bacterium]